jgi:tRNA dimethylallyltransferase
MGPTGSGKTDMAIQLAARWPLEIVSVDSAMVYRHLDIGAAKPGPQLRAQTPHHLIDIREPWERYSAGEFRADALRLIREIRARDRVPLLTGGTMLYFHVLCHGLAELPQADPQLRAELDRRGEREGWPALHAELARVDPAAAVRIEPSDRQRIQRALEVYYLTTQPISQLQRRTAAAEDVRYLRIGLIPGDRTALYRGLDERLRDMIRRGFPDEVRALMRMPLMNPHCASMRAVGYRQLWSHLAGESDLATAIRQAAVATHRLAKRQLSWLRGYPADLLADPQASECADRVAAFIVNSGVVAA